MKVWMGRDTLSFKQHSRNTSFPSMHAQADQNAPLAIGMASRAALPQENLHEPWEHITSPDWGGNSLTNVQICSYAQELVEGIQNTDGGFWFDCNAYAASIQRFASSKIDKCHGRFPVAGEDKKTRSKFISDAAVLPAIIDVYACTYLAGEIELVIEAQNNKEEDANLALLKERLSHLAPMDVKLTKQRHQLLKPCPGLDFSRKGLDVTGLCKIIEQLTHRFRLLSAWSESITDAYLSYDEAVRRGETPVFVGDLFMDSDDPFMAIFQLEVVEQMDPTTLLYKQRLAKLLSHIAEHRRFPSRTTFTGCIRFPAMAKRWQSIWCCCKKTRSGGEVQHTQR